MTSSLLDRKLLPGVSAIGVFLLLAHCGSSQTESSRSSGDSGIEAGARGNDADGDAEAAVPADSAAPRCGSPCPASEPSEGDPCSFDWCEYGGSPFFECDRSYGCESGHVVTITAPDASSCAPSSASCPSTRTSIAPGSACTSPAQCIFPEGECDCLAEGNGASPLWFCAGPDGGSGGSCPIPRAPLGSPCPSSDQVGSPLCQPLGSCRVETCSACGTWTNVPIPCGGP
jgi:hypothetical protein